MHKSLLLIVAQWLLCMGLMAKQPPIAKTDTNTINALFEEYLNLRESTPNKAMEYLQNGILIARQIKSKEKMALLLYHKGYLYRKLGIYNLALVSDLNALELYESIDNQNEKSWLLIDIGLVYFYNQKNYLMAIDRLNKALENFQASHNNIGIIVANYDLGQVYHEMGKYETALSYYNLSVKLSKEFHLADHEAISYALIGQTKLKMNDFKSAARWFHQAFEIYSKVNNRKDIAYSYQNFAALALAKGEKNQALAYYDSALHNYSAITYKDGITQTYAKIAAVHASLGDLNRAVSYAERSLQVADSNQLVYQQMIILPIISDYYAQLNQLSNSYLYLKRYLDTKESSNVKYAQQLEAEYAFQNNIQEKLLQDEIDLKHKIIIGFLSGGILLFLFLSALIYYKNRELRKSYQHLFKNNVALHLKEEELAQINKQTKYNRSTLKDEQQETLLTELVALMEIKKEYLKNDLNLDDLAKQLNSNRTYISQIINDNFCTNFSNFINEYRVKEAQGLLLNTSSKNLTIEAIAQNVGFNSKSSFNTAFKKLTGLTPSHFMEMQSQANEGCN